MKVNNLNEEELNKIVGGKSTTTATIGSGLYKYMNNWFKYKGK
ncbi:bacteriocin [Lactobacillus agrestimuris]|nr:bacteriocin [Lactobacillus agrestimuris]